MGLKVYGLVILSSLALLAVAVDVQNHFGEETSGLKGDELTCLLTKKQVSNVLTEVV